jgi:hypothetical protein
VSVSALVSARSRARVRAMDKIMVRTWDIVRLLLGRCRVRVRVRVWFRVSVRVRV